MECCVLIPVVVLRGGKDITRDPTMDSYVFPRATGILSEKDRLAGEFSKALARLASDARYREPATPDPSVITRDFKLPLKELTALRQVAIHSGANIMAIDKFRVSEMALSVADKDPDNGCCCCCCGETAMASIEGVSFS
jgi:hypothetical protein